MSTKTPPQTHALLNLEEGAHPKLSKKSYADQLLSLQYEMRRVSLAYFQQGISGVIVIEGTDTAGKGGAIRRMTSELDPRHYKVWPIGPPTDEEMRHHYLWRFWKRMPESGLIGIFDRSWYGRVLVERVEKMTPEADWRRAYVEICDFEKSLVDAGKRMVKIYLHVTKEEQRARLEERLARPEKHWKISTADIQSHVLRDAYLDAATEMFEHTSTPDVPWHLVAADNKRHARIAVLKHVTETLGKGIDLTPRPLDGETIRLAREVFD